MCEKFFERWSTDSFSKTKTSWYRLAFGFFAVDDGGMIFIDATK